MLLQLLLLLYLKIVADATASTAAVHICYQLALP
jgi:hypothetical protein